MQPRLPNNIYLCGFMGVGKSTVGPLLASRLGWHFLDADQWIVQAVGKTITAIFQSEGESAFRDWESRAITEVSKRNHQVVSLGGGALLNSENRRVLLASGLLVFLSASVDSLMSRINPADRPVLAGLKGDALRFHIEALLKGRLPSYREANLSIETDGKSPERVAEQILSEVLSWKP